MNQFLGPEAFYREITEKLTQRLGDGTHAQYRRISKNNGVFMNAVVVGGERKIRPTIYLDGYYEEYCEGRPGEDIVEEIAKVYRDHILSDDNMMDFFTDFARVRERICYRLVNTARNEKMLREVPHREFLDLSLVYYYMLDEDLLSSGSILLKNEHLDLWKVTEEELFGLSTQNTKKLLPAECISILSMLRSTGCELPEWDEEAAQTLPMYVLSNEKRVCGAACMLYEKFRDILPVKCDYYILPSSIHELILLPKDSLPEGQNLNELVKQVNDSQVPPWEILSDSVYYYDYEKNTITLPSQKSIA